MQTANASIQQLYHLDDCEPLTLSNERCILQDYASAYRETESAAARCPVVLDQFVSSWEAVRTVNNPSKLVVGVFNQRSVSREVLDVRKLLHGEFLKLDAAIAVLSQTRNCYGRSSPQYEEQYQRFSALFACLRLTPRYRDRLLDIPRQLLTRHQHISYCDETELKLIEQNIGVGLLKEYTARDLVINAHLRFVYAMAHAITRYVSDDLMQVGVLAMLEAWESFHINLGIRFSTYSSYWIRSAILLYLDDARNQIRLPKKICSNLRLLDNTEKRLIQQLGGQPTVQELHNASGISQSVIIELQQLMIPIQSLDTPDNENSMSTLAEELFDDDIAVIDQMVVEEQQETINEALNALLPDDKSVIVLRFGLMCHEPHTRAEVSKRLHLTEAQVRYREGIAITEMRQFVLKRLS